MTTLCDTAGAAVNAPIPDPDDLSRYQTSMDTNSGYSWPEGPDEGDRALSSFIPKDITYAQWPRIYSAPVWFSIRESDFCTLITDGDGRPIPEEEVRRVIGSLADYLLMYPGYEERWAKISERVDLVQEYEEMPWDSRSVGTPGVVYLIQGGGLFKVGRTKDIESRLRSHQSQCSFPLTVVHKIDTDNTEKAEAFWHRKFAESHHHYEWFTLTEEQVCVFCSIGEMV